MFTIPCQLDESYESRRDLKVRPVHKAARISRELQTYICCSVTVLSSRVFAAMSMTVIGHRTPWGPPAEGRQSILTFSGRSGLDNGLRKRRIGMGGAPQHLRKLRMRVVQYDKITGGLD